MDRRKALLLTTSILGSTMIGADFFLSGCTRKITNKALFSDADMLFLDEVGETILPETDRSPGAKAAKIGAFMVTIVTDCYDQKEQTIFKEGIDTIGKMAHTAYSKSFLKLDPDHRQDLLVRLDNQARTIPEGEPPHYFTMLKQLTIWGYFTSEPGATKALRYLPIPGSFKGCVPYNKGDKAWA
ncbi:MAG: gluconate 2-dehydrogenase subunit 3 family protein [Maribacter sp.]|uniref:gluconate 2-dehydrogenase subunit 3 family protein n=1 Tax=Maribacter sp. TaxID=1897614 RepID=UPI003C72165A